MYELTANTLQNVLANQNILFTDTPVCSRNDSIVHRDGSGIITLRGITGNQCRARFKISFGGNVSIPTGGTVGPISIAFSINGETIPATTAIFSPAATGVFGNLNTSIFVDVPKGCCSQISVKNINTSAIDVQNANLIVERVA